MGGLSSTIKPQELIEFRKLNTTIDNVEIPARPESRTVTDKKGFILFGIGILLLLPFLIYSLTKSDLHHLSHFHDDCGNFCGLNNTKIEGIYCSGKDHSSKPYWHEVYNRCTNYCGYNYVTRGGKCIHEKNIDEDEDKKFNAKVAFESSRTEGWKFFVTILITIVLSVLTLVALRYMPAAVVWTLLIFSVVALLAITGILWYFYSQVSNASSDWDPESKTRTVMQVAAPIWTVFVIIILIIIIVLIKKIRLIIQLYKEAVKVLAAMPLLIIVTILITFIQFVILGIFYATHFYLTFALDLYPKYNGSVIVGYKYLYSFVTIFTMLLNIFVTIWAMHFVSGVQYMIISGSVARWFFSRNKQYLESPIVNSTKVALKYHLGTVAFGSFLIMLFSIVKSILKAFCRNVCCRCCFVICCSPVEIILKFISENSYIQTAVHGQSYCKSAKRATKLLLTNAKSVAAINCVGDFLLVIIILIVALIASVISYALFMNNPPLRAIIPTTECVIINLIIVSITFATFQIIIDTLLLCFCEDSVLNDGISRPYYMSKNLMEFVENSKKIYG